jgi:hypothetical protein
VNSIYCRNEDTEIGLMALINCAERMRGRRDSNPEDLSKSGLEAKGVIFVEVLWEPYETKWGLKESTKLRMGNTGTSGGETEVQMGSTRASGEGTEVQIESTETSGEGTEVQIESTETSGEGADVQIESTGTSGGGTEVQVESTETSGGGTEGARS